MNLQDLQKEWTKDAPINKLDLDNETSHIPSLHAKYINILSSIRKDILKAEKVFLKLRRFMTKYYKGTATKEELTLHGVDQYQGKSPLKTELDALLEHDEDMMIARSAIEELIICKDYTESVMKSIHSRTYDIKNILAWLTYSSGQS
jgi:hypothetical protein